MTVRRRPGPQSQGPGTADASVGDSITPLSRAAAAHSSTAENCGTPTPATNRVVHANPGPMPTLMASAPAAARSRTPSAVATLPAITSASGKPLELAHGLERRIRVAVGDVEHERIRIGGEQRLGALQVAPRTPDRARPHASPSASRVASG